MAAPASASAGAAPASVARGPQPGEIYREFAAHQTDRAWRVTNPNAKSEKARKLSLPNPINRITLGKLEGAIRAEALIDRWCGHLGSKEPRLRFNENEWLVVPKPPGVPGEAERIQYYYQDNPVMNIPLGHLKEGANLFEGAVSHDQPDGWGQWGIYSLIIRIYYDPAKLPQAPTGRIVSPTEGATLGENPSIRLEATSSSGVARIDVLAWYDGFDDNGDGVSEDWHGGYFQHIRGGPAELREHVGSLYRTPYELKWETRWVPDQQPRAVKLIARIQEVGGVWRVTEPVTGLTLKRDGETVRLYNATGITPRFGVRNKQAKSCELPIPADHDLGKIVEAGLHLRTWHGWDGHHQPYKLNDWVHPIEGKNHHLDYDIHLVPAKALRNGNNTFALYSETHEHTLEVHWPGPGLMIRYRK